MSDKKTNNSNQAITHNDLAEFGKMLLNGIAEMFDKVYERFDQVDQRFEQVDQRFEQVDGEIASVKTELGQVKVELNQVQTDLKQVKTDVKQVKKDVKEIRNNNVQVIGELQAIREDQVLIPHQISRNSSKIDNHELRISSLERIAPSSL